MRRGDLKAIGAGLLAAGALSATAVQAVAFIVTVFPISTIALNQGVNTVLNNNTEATNATLEAVKYRLGEFEKRLVAAIDGHAQSTMHSMAGNTVSAATQEANSSASIIQAQGALATQREREETAARLRLLRDKLIQPLTTCLAITGGTALPRSNQVVRIATAQGTSQDRRVGMSNASPAVSAAQNYDYVMAKFCSPASQKRGVCSGAVDPKLADGDVNASLLFGDGAGARTREPQLELAAQAVAQRLAGTRGAPPLLAEPSMEKTAAGKAYEEARRDYVASSQLASACLQKTRMNTRPQAGLAQALANAGIAPDQLKSDISLADASRIFIESQLAPSRMNDLAGANEVPPLMRSMVQTRAFGLWVQNSRLQTALCNEALASNQLSLAAQRQFADKAATLSRVATGVSPAAGGAGAPAAGGQAPNPAATGG